MWFLGRIVRFLGSEHNNSPTKTPTFLSSRITHLDFAVADEVLAVVSAQVIDALHTNFGDSIFNNIIIIDLLRTLVRLGTA